MKILGAILSGGKSSRMGTDKGLMTIDGKAMVEYSIALLKHITEDIVISTSNADYEKFGCRLIPDVIPNLGPIGGLYTILKQTDYQAFFFMPCDMPFAKRELANKLLSFKDEYDIVVPIHKDRVHPLMGYYSRNILPIIDVHIKSGNYKIQNLLKKCNTMYYPIDDDMDNLTDLKNINTPEDAKNNKHRQN